MSTLTRDQVRQLKPEHQETIGTLEARRIKKRQQLLEFARGYSGKVTFPVVCAVMIFGLYYFGAPMQLCVAIGVLSFCMLIQFHVTCINRRLDSLMELLEDKLELTDEVKGKIEQSRREIADGQFTARKVE